MTRAAQLLEEILGARPPGWFADVQPLLDEYVRLHLEIGALWPQLHQTRPGTRRSLELTIEVCAKMTAAGELAEVLRLLPGDRCSPPPRLQ